MADLSSRNLCAKDWILANPGGTVSQFAQHYAALTSEQKKVRSLLSQ